MKTASILILALLTGACATPPTLEELELKARLTGDWSAVDRRERYLARRTARSPAQCSDGNVSVCSECAGQHVCECVDRDALDALLSWR